MENRVWVVKANVAGCATDPLRGSHGMSCVIDPFGRVVAEAGVNTEEMITHNIDVGAADALYAKKAASALSIFLLICTLPSRTVCHLYPTPIPSLRNVASLKEAT